MRGRGRPTADLTRRAKRRRVLTPGLFLLVIGALGFLALLYLRAGNNASRTVPKAEYDRLATELSVCKYELAVERRAPGTAALQSEERSNGSLQRALRASELRVQELTTLLQSSQDAAREERAELQRLRPALETTERSLDAERHGRQEAEARLSETSAETERSALSPSTERVWLTIGIPTVPRAGADYLTSTLEALARQFPHSPSDPLRGRVRVVIVNNRPGEHKSFERLRTRLGSDKAHFAFYDNHDKQDDPMPGRLDRGTPNVPGHLVRRQTRDVVSLLRLAATEHSSDHFLFMEDDFELCDHGLLGIHYMLSRASLYHGNWMAVRASFGLNGVFVQGSDLPALADFFERHQKRRPPDHLMVEWFAGETPETAAYRGARQHVAFRYNIFNHIGTRSTLRGSKSPTYPLCWEQLGEPTLFNVESFKEKECPRDDIWPCSFAPPTCNEFRPCPLGTPLSTPPPVIPWNQLAARK